MINNRVKLSTLENNLPVSLKDKEYDPNQIIVIKRDGRIVEYDRIIKILHQKYTDKTTI